MSQPYNKIYHYRIVKKFKSLYFGLGLNAPLMLTDQDIFDKYNFAYTFDKTEWGNVYPEMENRFEAFTLSMIVEANNNRFFMSLEE